MDVTQPLLPHEVPLLIASPTENSGGGFVEFDPAGDPENPLEWPRTYKWTVVVALAFMAFVV
jgi:hypothetical protein